MHLNKPSSLTKKYMQRSVQKWKHSVVTSVHRKKNSVSNHSSLKLIHVPSTRTSSGNLRHGLQNEPGSTFRKRRSCSSRNSSTLEQQNHCLMKNSVPSSVRTVSHPPKKRLRLLNRCLKSGVSVIPPSFIRRTMI